MPALIGMSNAAWKRQPSGRLRPNWNSAVLNAIQPMALFVPSGVPGDPFSGNTIIDLMETYSVEPFLDANIRAGTPGIGAWTESKNNVLDDESVSCWRSNLFPSAEINSFFNYYQLLNNVSASAYYVNGSHSGQNARRLFAGAGGSAGNDRVIYGYGETFFNTAAGSIVPGLAGETHLTGLSTSPTVFYGYYDGRLLGSSSFAWTGGTSARSLFLGSRAFNKGINDFSVLATPSNLMLWTVVGRGYLDAAGVADLYANPWQLLDPAPSRFYLIPTAPVLTIPTLSAPGVTDITATAARPQVTLTY